MKKKLLTIVFFALIVASVFAYSGGNGTESNPYLISSKADMSLLASMVNTAENYSSGKYFLLTRDLTGLNDTVTTIVGKFSSTNMYIHPVAFMGSFDGNGHEISINIKVNENNSDINFFLSAGIFGYSSGATIKSLKVSGKITFESALKDYFLNFYGGGICGYADATTITNCYNTVDIISCFNYAGNSCIGGICGYMTSHALSSATISCCYNNGDISSLSISNHLFSGTYYAYCGGICGYMENICDKGKIAINNCYNNGKISSSLEIPVTIGTSAYSGGICGGGESELYQFGSSQNTTISKCYNIGDVSTFSNSPNSFSPYSGGICGFGCYVDNCFVDNCQITNNYASNIGRISGNSTSVKNCYSDNLALLNGTRISNANPDHKNGKDVMTTSLQSSSWLQSTLNWNFSTVWCIMEVGKFPELQMQYSTSIVFNLPEISYGDQIALDAVSTNTTIPVLFTSSDNSVAEIIGGNLLVAKKAGNVTITAFQLSSGNAFIIGENAVNVTITKAPLTITAENKQREQGEENPPFALLYSGFKNGENESVLDVLPTIYCAANINSPVGFYAIVLSGGLDNNYDYTLINGKLEVIAPNGLGKIDVSKILIYPNPAKNYLFIQSESPIEKVEIYNQSGMCVLINDNVMEKLDVSSLVNGFYLARIYVDEIPVIKKIVIKK